MLGAFLGYMGLAVATAERLSAAPFYRWSRDVGRAQIGLAVAVVYAPLLSGAVAVAAGIGVNMATDTGGTAKVAAGWGFTLGSLGALAWGGRWLLHKSNDGRLALSRVRSRLRQHADPQHAPVDAAAALAWTRQINQVGQRLTRRGNTLTLRQWARWRSRQVGSHSWYGGLSLAGAGACLILGLTSADPSLPGWPLLSLVMFGAALCCPIALMLDMRTDRWWLLKLGMELSAEAHRAETVLLRSLAPDSYPHRLRQWWRQRPRRR